MLKQKYEIHVKETAIKIQNTEILSIRKKDINRKAIRVIENGKIGISGVIGNIDDNILTEKAIENLKIDIAYDVEPEEPQQKIINLKNSSINHENIINKSEKLLKYLKKEYKEFDFSETIRFSEDSIQLSDSNGTNLQYMDNSVSIGLIIKEKTSSNLMDGFIGFSGRELDVDKFIDKNTEYLNAYKVEAKIPEGEKLPVIFFNDSNVIGKISTELNGEKYGNGSSLFANKIGEKLFNENLTVIQNSNPEITSAPFFDSEGSVNDNFEVVLIENGILKSCYADKKTAKKYDLPKTAAAQSEYDDVPSLPQSLFVDIKLSEDKLCNKVKKGIFVLMASGGDFTADGTYATPVQKAFLYENGKIVGKLPEFSVKSHLYDMYGDDYIGTFKSPLYTGEHAKVIAFNMKIEK